MNRNSNSVSVVLRALLLCFGLLFALPALAQAPFNTDQVLLENRWAKVTRGDYEAELLRLPPDVRGGFALVGKRVSDLLNRLLLTKSLAAQARAAGLDKDPEMQRRVELELERIYAGLQIAKLDESSGKAFDARRPQFDARARELYVARRDAYRVPEQISASHILFDTKKRTKEEALKLAQDTRAKILAGADFNDLARQLSDDPSAQQNQGHLDYFDRRQMDPAFSGAAFALKNVGDLSEPVASSFGVHLIKLDGRRPESVRSFDDVKDAIIAEQRTKYIEEQRELTLAPLRNDNDVKVNQAAIDALVIKIDQDRVRKAMESSPK